jgi:anti-anti-sigma factor
VQCTGAAQGAGNLCPDRYASLDNFRAPMGINEGKRGVTQENPGGHMSTVAAMEAAPVRVLETVAGTEVVISGRLDVHTVADVRLLLHDVVDRGAGDLMLHLGAAEVHDATGLGVIVGAHHRARRAGRRLVLVDVSPRLDRLLRVSRLHRVLARDEDRSPRTLVGVSPLTA